MLRRNMSKTASKKEEEPLQAIVAIDCAPSFSIFPKKSAAMMPVANIPLIDFTIECLSRAGVKDVFVFCAAGVEELERHISETWRFGPTQVRIVVVPTASTNLAGVMREVYSSSLLSSDEFILVESGLISNSLLQEGLKAHKQRRAKDKNAVMTLCFSQCDPNHPSRSRQADCLIGYERQSSQLVSFEPLSASSANMARLSLSALDDDDIFWRLDLLDCKLAFCSKQIPALFQDNFDYQTRSDVVKEILDNEELLGFRLHVSILEKCYVASVCDFSTYFSISNDVLARWAYPLCLDTGVAAADVQQLYGLFRNCNYIHRANTSCPTEALVEYVAVGCQTEIDRTSKLTMSIVGNGCRIGRNVSLYNVIVWHNSSVGDNCTIKDSLICDNVVIQDNCVVKERCILLSNFLLSSNSVLEPGTVLGADTDAKSSKARSVSASSRKSARSEDSTSEPQSSGSVWPAWQKLIPSAIEDSEESGDEGSQSSEDEEKPEEDETQLFYSEIFESLQRGVDERVNCETLRFEINSSKHAYNISIDDVYKMVTKAVLEIAFANTTLTWNKIEPILGHFAPLLKDYFRNSADQLLSLQELQKFVEDSTNHAGVSGFLSKTLYLLYDKDVYSEEVLLKWHKQLSKQSDVFQKVASFVEWLETAESDDED